MSAWHYRGFILIAVVVLVIFAAIISGCSTTEKTPALPTPPSGSALVWESPTGSINIDAVPICKDYVVCYVLTTDFGDSPSISCIHTPPSDLTLGKVYTKYCG